MAAVQQIPHLQDAICPAQVQHTCRGTGQPERRLDTLHSAQQSDSCAQECHFDRCQPDRAGLQNWVSSGSRHAHRLVASRQRPLHAVTHGAPALAVLCCSFAYADMTCTERLAVTWTCGAPAACSVLCSSQRRLEEADVVAALLPQGPAPVACAEQDVIKEGGPLQGDHCPCVGLGYGLAVLRVLLTLQARQLAADRN